MCNENNEKASNKTTMLKMPPKNTSAIYDPEMHV